jgi:hypothetical protein
MQISGKSPNAQNIHNRKDASALPRQKTSLDLLLPVLDTLLLATLQDSAAVLAVTDAARCQAERAPATLLIARGHAHSMMNMRQK